MSSSGSSRNSEEKKESSHLDHSTGKATLNEKQAAYIRNCMVEKHRMKKNYPIAEKLLEIEIDKVYLNGRTPAKEYYANIYREKPMRVAQKVLIPVREHPKFNFVGKLLGPKGNSLRRLQDETLCKIIILGRNSMKDHAKEEELKSCDDPKFNHFTKDLHVEISTFAPPLEAYGRIAYALDAVRKYLIPDSNDEIRQKQYKELKGSSTSKSLPLTASRSPTHSSSYMKTTKPPKVRYVYEEPHREIVLLRPRNVIEHTSYASHPYEYAPTHVKLRPAYERPEYESEYGRMYIPRSPTYSVPARKSYYPVSVSPGASRARYHVAPYPLPRK